MIKLLRPLRRYFLILPAVFLSLGSSYLFAEEPSLPANVKVILLANNAVQACGTGFSLSPGSVITNYHLAKTLCPENDCDNLRAYISQNTGSPATEVFPLSKAKIRRFFSGLDIAFISSTENAPDYGSFEELGIVTQKLKESLKLNVFGYPRCKELKSSEGEIVSLNPLRLDLSASGAHGSSGSLVITPEGKLIGIVDEATSIWGGLKGKLLGSDFKLRALRLNIIKDISRAKDSKKAQIFALALYQYYQSFADTKGFSRYIYAADFQRLTEDFKQLFAETSKVPAAHTYITTLNSNWHSLFELNYATLLELFSTETFKLFLLITISEKLERIGLDEATEQKLLLWIKNLNITKKHQAALISLIKEHQSLNLTPSQYYTEQILYKTLVVFVIILIILMALGRVLLKKRKPYVKIPRKIS